LDFFGDSGKSLARRYGIVSDGDLGYQGAWAVSENGVLTLGLVNGEENKTQETGPNKEAFFGGFFRSKGFAANFWLSVGRVDQIEDSVSAKNRALVRLEKEWGRLSLGVEGLYAQDPSLDLESNLRLESIMFTELSDVKTISTTGGRIEMSYELSARESFVARADYLRPQWERKKIQSGELAWLKKESANMSWGMFYEKTEFGAQHSSQSKVRELARLGLKVGF
jgi:hypothetical protein